MGMRIADEEAEVKRRWARWYPKKDDDRILERWANACSKIHRECYNCDLRDHCQDLADRLIASMSITATGGRKTRRKQGSKRRPGYGL